MSPRTTAPEDQYTAAPFVPADADLATLRRAAATCRGCPLHRDATQTVFGAGSASARVMLVGEQPGDREDRRGEPFVGPAGKLLDRALRAAAADAARTFDGIEAVRLTCRGGLGLERFYGSCGYQEVGRVPGAIRVAPRRPPRRRRHAAGAVPTALTPVKDQPSNVLHWTMTLFGIGRVD